MCWHFETPPQEFLAVYYKNRPLCAGSAEGWGVGKSDGETAVMGTLCHPAGPYRQGRDTNPGT